MESLQSFELSMEFGIKDFLLITDDNLVKLINIANRMINNACSKIIIKKKITEIEINKQKTVFDVTETIVFEWYNLTIE